MHTLMILMSEPPRYHATIIALIASSAPSPDAITAITPLRFHIIDYVIDELPSCHRHHVQGRLFGTHLR